MRLKLLREQNRLTQEMLAKAVGVKQHTLSQWENGKRSPRSSKLIELSSKLHCTVDDLLRDDNYDSSGKDQQVGVETYEIDEGGRP